MDDVSRKAVTEIHDRRSRRVSRAIAARRRIDRAPLPARFGGEPARTGGRVWVNGVEMGGTDPRHEALAASHD
jgi:hypothetical protein